MSELFTSLARLPTGTKCKVTSILSTGNNKRRMLDLGIICNTDIEVLQKSPYGDPTAYFIRGAVIALREEDAKKIIVRLSE